MYQTMICERCKEPTPRKSQIQKYCLPCSKLKRYKPVSINMKTCPECKSEYNAYACDQTYCSKECRKQEYERKMAERWAAKTKQPKAYKKLHNLGPSHF